MVTSEGGPAFPEACDGGYDNSGMTLKDYFAGQALAGLMANPAVVDADITGFLMSDATVTYARMAYKMAGAMLAEREKRREAAHKAKGEPQEDAAPCQ